jgi:hypothetical protein
MTVVGVLQKKVYNNILSWANFMADNSRKKAVLSRCKRRIIRRDDYYRLMTMRLLLLLVVFKFLGG